MRTIGGYDESVPGIGIIVLLCLTPQERWLLWQQPRLMEFGFDWTGNNPAVVNTRTILTEVAEHPRWMFHVVAKELCDG